MKSALLFCVTAFVVGLITGHLFPRLGNNGSPVHSGKGRLDFQPEPHESSEVVNFKNLASQDPEECVRLLQSEYPLADALGIQQVAISEMMHRDPDKCLAFARSLNGHFGRQFLTRCLTFLAHSDPEKALAAAENRESIEDILSIWSEHDPKTAVEYCLNLTESEADEIGVPDRCLRSWVLSDLDGFTTFLDSPRLSKQIRNQLASVAIEQLAAIYPSKAHRLMEGALEPEHGRYRPLQELCLRLWAKDDEKSAFEAIERLENPLDRESAYSSTAFTLAMKNRERVSELAGGIQSHSEKVTFLREFGERQARIDEAGASSTIDWALNSLSGEDRDLVAVCALRVLAKSEPKAAVRALSGSRDFLEAALDYGGKEFDPVFEQLIEHGVPQ
jgi:hypothetical protein